MKPWQRAVATIANDIEEKFDRLKYGLVDRLHLGQPVMILPFRGFATERTIFLKGRVLEDQGLRGSTDNDSVWDNLLSAYRRIESDEIPHARVTMKYGAFEETIEADEEGFFLFDMEIPGGIRADELHHEVELFLPDEIRGQTDIRATGQFVLPPSDSDFGIISDIDDTVIETNATNLMRAARLTFLENARTRQPFEGVASFYQALQVGPSGTKSNPIFFVSSGPWNLYDLLVEFMEHNEIPSGPIFLQDYGIKPDVLVHEEHLKHKTAAISRILDTYPDLKFVLIGDSGQKDPEIYRAIVDRYPGRILAIYIRDVTQDTRDAEIHHLADELSVGGVHLVLVSDSKAAADHAAENGLIAPHIVPAVVEGTNRDQSEPTETEKIVAP